MLPAMNEVAVKYGIKKIEKAKTPAFLLETEHININEEMVEFLRQHAKDHPDKRSRFCFHSSRDEEQKMLIYMERGSIITPFKQDVTKKIFIVLKGSIRVKVLEGDKQNWLIGDDQGSQMCLINPTKLHEVIPESEETLFFEIF